MQALRHPIHHLRLALPAPSIHRPWSRSSVPPIFIPITSRIVRGRGVMSSRREDSIPHELRTAAEPRQNRLYPVRLSHVEYANSSVRLLQLTLPRQDCDDVYQEPFSFLPGQWLDVHIPSISTAGGFTITSTPADARVLPSLDSPIDPPDGENPELSVSESRGREPFVELAVQEAQANPPAAWLWKPLEEILGKPLNIRVGGSFTWPPSVNEISAIKNVVMIAGGVGINPLISILAHLNNESSTSPPLHVHLLYSSRLPPGHTAAHKSSESPSIEDLESQILFLPRIRSIIRSQQQARRLRVSLDLFLTPASSSEQVSVESPADLTEDGTKGPFRAVHGQDGKRDSRESVAYVCGPPQMTDTMVEMLEIIMGAEGGKSRIFYEKWW
ncbi:hypothetical protein N7539_001194 [Penicillium diatomitis]|uniref:FAD-binding FR-type domain-containing protein n=1 Tax=Penicillium diatomitis TaxID=2819901 RepID=A0A9W9XNA5_9EURO|nr:uncharacterized protein N7539_001194 [Penicillium diatomitis]KAJ5496078.1 hypothetical protein N7539_001194 [Penicillium diatomitis]